MTSCTGQTCSRKQPIVRPCKQSMRDELEAWTKKDKITRMRSKSKDLLT